VLILRLPHRRWSLPLGEEEEDDGCGGGALGAPPIVALLSVLSRSGWMMRNGMIYLGSSSSGILFPRIQPYPLYMKIGWVHVPEFRRILQRCSMDRDNVVELKRPWASFGCSILILYMSGYVSLDRPPLGGPSGVFLVAKEVAPGEGSRWRTRGGVNSPL
jgi:hypothetical protein